MNIVVDDLLTTYQLEGKGQLIVFLHGWADDMRGGGQVMKQLAKSYKILSIDLPGFGNTQPPKAVWNLDNYAAFVAAVLQKLKTGDPYAIIGHSNGGAIAVRGAAQGVLKPKKLVLLAASGVRSGGSGKRLLLKTIAKVGKVATFWLPRRYRRALRKSLYGTAGSDMLVVENLQETFKKTVRQDVQKDAALITLPTLLVYAEDDKAVPLSDGKRYQQLIKNSTFKAVAGAGHFVHLDKPQEVADYIQEFLA